MLAPAFVPAVAAEGAECCLQLPLGCGCQVQNALGCSRWAPQSKRLSLLMLDPLNDPLVRYGPPAMGRCGSGVL